MARQFRGMAVRDERTLSSWVVRVRFFPSRGPRASSRICEQAKRQLYIYYFCIFVNNFNYLINLLNI